ncbi:MAG: hypothetical protein IPL84_07665 [Chitinophagaceae bacterium]|nr:hypothetical protein [Chitinophagaceae bacterium]
MKTLFSILTLLILTVSAFAQEGDYDELMQKSRKARTTSTIMVATGPVIAAAGIGTLIYGLIKKEDVFTEYDYNGNPIPTKNTSTEIIVGAAGAAVGIALALTSIHFSNKASDLKREARRAKLKTSMDRISIPGFQNGFASNRTRQFKLSLIVPFGS